MANLPIGAPSGVPSPIGVSTMKNQSQNVRVVCAYGGTYMKTIKRVVSHITTNSAGEEVGRINYQGGKTQVVKEDGVFTVKHY